MDHSNPCDPLFCWLDPVPLGLHAYHALVKWKRFWFFSGMKVAFSHLELFLEELRKESASVHRSILRVMICEDGYDLYVLAGAVIGGELVEGRIHCGCLTSHHEQATREKAEFVYDKIAGADKDMGLEVRNGIFEGY